MMSLVVASVNSWASSGKQMWRCGMHRALDARLSAICGDSDDALYVGTYTKRGVSRDNGKMGMEVAILTGVCNYSLVDGTSRENGWQNH